MKPQKPQEPISVRKKQKTAADARKSSVRGRSEEALRRGEEHFRRLLEAAPDAILEVDAQGKIMILNQVAEQIFGYGREELLGKKVEILVPDAMRSAHACRRELYTHDHPGIRSMGIGLELQGRRKDGTTFPVEISLSPNRSQDDLSVIAIVRDMTAHHKLQDAVRRSEERLRQAQELESLGRLAGGIAHEFNNLLTMVLGYAELLQSSLAGDELLSNYVEKTRKAARRASTLTRQLLAFSRRQVLEPKVMDLNSVVIETCQVLVRTLEDIEIQALPSEERAWIRADRNQMELMLVNLATNAREAMPEGGRLTFAVSLVELGKVELGEPEAPSHPGLMPGRYVLLTVSDTGNGMSPEVQSRIFEPFFSTRDFGKGPGLGLSAVYGIVNQSGGSITVQSQPQAGTTFSIFLPWIAGDETTASASISPEMLEGSETILLVDDQPQLVEMMRTFLEKMGYTILTASSPEKALRLVREHQGEIDVLITDVMMPGMNGLELARRLRAERSTMKVLYTSGYTEQNLEELSGFEETSAFLEKPFALEDLALKVRGLCDVVR
ncbi:MAG: PAS domain S-box protein [Acidobacteriia bacterium]|nr:PAS domain S-box protein [Terriglobia bacterium]